MNRFIEERREQLVELCARYRVRRLEVFGSGADHSFDPERSDLDFLVEFHELSRGQYADAYFGLIEDLQDLFKRPVDLLMTSAIKNPYLLEKISQSRIVLYAA